MAPIIWSADGGFEPSISASPFTWRAISRAAIGYWPQLVDTLFAIRDRRYPNGWLDEIGLTNHNNYDVAVLLQLGWPHMRADQRRRAEQELARLLDWCLTTAISPDGEVVARAVGELLPESYYFTIAFLDTVGYFDPSRRFWTELEFPEAPAVRERLERPSSEIAATRSDGAHGM